MFEVKQSAPQSPPSQSQPLNVRQFVRVEREVASLAVEIDSTESLTTIDCQLSAVFMLLVDRNLQDPIDA